MASGLAALGDNEIASGIGGRLRILHRADLPGGDGAAVVGQFHHGGIRPRPEEVDDVDPAGCDLDGDVVHRVGEEVGGDGATGPGPDGVKDARQLVGRTPECGGGDGAEATCVGDRNAQFGTRDRAHRCLLDRDRAPEQLSHRGGQHIRKR
ncbi:MAG: hypothetical protein NVSMB16_03190 [Acidimicrobiales bacterium]